MNLLRRPLAARRLEDICGGRVGVEVAVGVAVAVGVDVAVAVGAAVAVSAGGGVFASGAVAVGGSVGVLVGGGVGEGCTTLTVTEWRDSPPALTTRSLYVCVRVGHTSRFPCPPMP
mgnify:CR=1 FL=1